MLSVHIFGEYWSVSNSGLAKTLSCCNLTAFVRSTVFEVIPDEPSGSSVGKSWYAYN